eukprot:CAMPEP_0172573500 /NCGR_PEP_ID=MMETSP1067-20121228/136225_1 /TAXON_ID=265564 ORGANISM="Thalassiosira punctigera, Strain Tpunct2005C2" /NCGR_SAMPLE_ID=MMETSP1067 /ASSEMBLY_ACC=CAM_ASM_000444 /LENGTH=197 /DNA_ID=CAMNT_0013366107 /DNA_START=1827 /DNA_END=2420 /DNA_ORIENTATION=+
MTISLIFRTASAARRRSLLNRPKYGRSGFAGVFRMYSTSARRSSRPKNDRSSLDMAYSNAVSDSAPRMIPRISSPTSKDIDEFSSSRPFAKSFIHSWVFSDATLVILLTWFEEKAGAVAFRLECHRGPSVVSIVGPPVTFRKFSYSRCGFVVEGSVSTTRETSGSPTTKKCLVGANRKKSWKTGVGSERDTSNNHHG